MTPGANVKVYFPNHFYTKFGVARATSPDGPVTEHNQNKSGFKFKTANSGVFLIDKVGYRVDAAPGQMQTWIRGAPTYTSSRYFDQGDPTRRGSGSYGLFFLADRQLLQTAPEGGPRAAYRGLYAGFSVEYAPPQFNRFSQYYEARVYGFGLIPGRPFDLASLVATENVFSSNAVNLAKRRGLLTHDDTQQITLSYSAHMLPGVNLNTGLTYTSNPTSVTYSGSTGSALNVLIGVLAFL